tara:strand:+ start:274 stop:687 length:414 start_codon:yes stop_codon:yes gene_type:complete
MNAIDKLTSAQLLALHKALSERVSAARKVVPTGEHTVSVRVEGEPVELLLTVSKKTKDFLLAPPYREIATHLMGKVNQATIDALVTDATDTKWKPSTDAAVVNAFDDIRTGRDQWRRGSRRVSVTVVEDSSEGRENG